MLPNGSKIAFFVLERRTGERKLGPVGKDYPGGEEESESSRRARFLRSSAARMTHPNRIRKRKKAVITLRRRHRRCQWIRISKQILSSTVQGRTILPGEPNDSGKTMKRIKQKKKGKKKREKTDAQRILTPVVAASLRMASPTSRRRQVSGVHQRANLFPFDAQTAPSALTFYISTPRRHFNRWIWSGPPDKLQSIMVTWARLSKTGHHVMMDFISARIARTVVNIQREVKKKKKGTAIRTSINPGRKIIPVDADFKFVSGSARCICGLLQLRLGADSYVDRES